MPEPVYIDVFLPLPVFGTFTYAVNEQQASVIQAGMRVVVPFGKKKIIPHYALTSTKSSRPFMR